MVAVGCRIPQGAVLEVLRPIDATVAVQGTYHFLVPFTLGAIPGGHGRLRAAHEVHREIGDVHHVARSVRVIVQVDTSLEERRSPGDG